MSKQYHSVQPSNNQSSGFQEYQTIDFLLLADGRKLVPNSISFEADVEVLTGNTNPLTDDKKIQLEHKIGFHSVCESWTCEVQSMGQIESINDYPRYVNMITSATQNTNDLLTLRAAAEGRGLTEQNGRYVLQPNGVKQVTASSVYNVNSANFSIKPSVCFNNSMGGQYSFSKNGYIKLSVNLARNNNFLYGADCDSQTVYKLNNPVIRFETFEDDGSSEKMLMNSVVSVKSSINSQQGNVQARVPSSAVNGVVVSFLDTANETDFKKNSYRLESYPNFESVRYMFNDSQNAYITYDITDESEAVQRGVEALSESGVNMASANRISHNKGYLIGTSFERVLDLSNQKFNIQLTSKTSRLNTVGQFVYMAFLTMLEM